MYAKFIDEHHVDFLSPPVLLLDGTAVANPEHELLLAQGYLPVTEDPLPRVRSGAKTLLSYRLESDAIRTVYTVEEPA